MCGVDHDRRTHASGSIDRRGKGKFPLFPSGRTKGRAGCNVRRVTCNGFQTIVLFVRMSRRAAIMYVHSTCPTPRLYHCPGTIKAFSVMLECHQWIVIVARGRRTHGSETQSIEAAKREQPNPQVKVRHTLKSCLECSGLDEAVSSGLCKDLWLWQRKENAAGSPISCLRPTAVGILHVAYHFSIRAVLWLRLSNWA